ncbi:hypothetical protein [Undibacterium terreum]|uniref:hypothetical protein n=1 Tax=Undibacterium terreum TaxID=1224302 RepID=UPI001664198A|nr:hypothetical protein [Undibacterium terreum]
MQLLTHFSSDLKSGIRGAEVALEYELLGKLAEFIPAMGPDIKVTAEKSIAVGSSLMAIDLHLEKADRAVILELKRASTNLDDGYFALLGKPRPILDSQNRVAPRNSLVTVIAVLCKCKGPISEPINTDQKEFHMLSFPRTRYSRRHTHPAPAITNATLLSADWAESERKRSLRQFGSARACWWSLNRTLHHAMSPAASLEQVMCAFHRRQQVWTAWRQRCIYPVNRIAEMIRQRGVVGGLIFSFQLGFGKGDTS